MGTDERSSVTIEGTLAGRRADGSASAKARERLRTDPWTAVAGLVARTRTTGSRTTRTRTDRRAGRGANGERVAGWFLNGHREGWHVFHDVPVGTRGANIGHLVIAPSGVFTVNTKDLKGTIHVAEHEIRHNGRPRTYYPKARDEADRAARLLGDGLGRPVTVRPILAILADDWRIDGEPTDIFVGSPASTRLWIQREPDVLSRGEMTAIARVAHRARAWSLR
jgi:hypothetical protein